MNMSSSLCLHLDYRNTCTVSRSLVICRQCRVYSPFLIQICFPLVSVQRERKLHFYYELIIHQRVSQASWSTKIIRYIDLYKNTIGKESDRLSISRNDGKALKRFHWSAVHLRDSYEFLAPWKSGGLVLIWSGSGGRVALSI